MRFRPLTGINFNARAKTRRKNVRRFRPLTGINFNAYQVFVDLTYIEFPSPHGDKFQPYDDVEKAVAYCFRPLTGINFNL